MMAMTIAPRLRRDNSEAKGRRTLSTISAPFTASAVTVAPAAEKSASRIPDFIPAPGSTATPAPSPTIFLTVSGVAATRGSPASTSVVTATFMSPPTPARRRGRVEKIATSSEQRTSARADLRERASGSNQEIRHQDQNHDDDTDDDFYQGQKIAVCLLMGRIIVARCSGIFELTMVGHRIPLTLPRPSRT